MLDLFFAEPGYYVLRKRESAGYIREYPIEPISSWMDRRQRAYTTSSEERREAELLLLYLVAATLFFFSFFLSYKEEEEVDLLTLEPVKRIRVYIFYILKRKRRITYTVIIRLIVIPASR